MTTHAAKPFRAVWLAAAAVLFIGLSGPADGQDADYREEYKRFNEALQAGDIQTAAAHAYRAWQAAETALGDDALTGILAYNYGQLVLFTDTEQAIKALKRADELNRGGIAVLPDIELQLYLAFAEFALNKGDTRRRNNLRDELLAIEQEGIEATPDIAAMWLQLASADLSDKKYESAKTNAAKAAETIKEAAPNQSRELASALLVRAVATILSDTESTEGLLEANRLLIDASRLFPPQESIETFDPMLGQILAWNHAADALFHTNENYEDSDQRPRYIRLNRREDTQPSGDHGFLIFDFAAIFDKQTPLEQCGIEWEERKPPTYPQNAADRGHIGAALIGYDIGTDKKVKHAIIISEVPEDGFRDLALKSMSGWRLKEVPLDHPDCRENFVASFRFVLDS